MRTANGDDEKTVVNESFSHFLRKCDSVEENEASSSRDSIDSPVLVSPDYAEDDESNNKSPEFELIPYSEDEEEGHEEVFENNNNLEIEENNNYQSIESVQAVSSDACRGCFCRDVRSERLYPNSVKTHCHCVKPYHVTWRDEFHCCFVLNPPPPVEQEGTFEDYRRCSFGLAAPPETQEEDEPRKKRTLESPISVEPKRTRKVPLTLSKPRARKRKVASTEVLFVSCEESPEETPAETPTRDPFAKLSLANRTKRLARDTTMYDHRQFAESAGVVAATGFYNPNKLPSTTAHEDVVPTASHHHHHHHQGSTSSTTSNSNAPNLDSNKTIATLCNIGNSCYLNSVVYTLRFAPLFLHKLHHLIEDMATIYVKLNPTKHKSSSLGRNVSLWTGHSGRSWSNRELAALGGISGNDMLPKNNRLIVTEKLHELYQNLHKNESNLNSEPLHAGAFLQAIQEVCSIFEGNQQQDAHECLMCILDSIRETCDTLATAIIDNPEQLLSEYGVSAAMLEESRDELAPMPAATQPKSSSGVAKLFSRKSKRKKSTDDERAPPDSPIKEPLKSGEDSETTSPTETRSEEYTRTLLLKALLGSAEDVTGDREKMKKTVCKQLGLNFFCEDFEGVSVSSIKCLTCESVRNCEETMVDISVPITGYENMDAMSNAQQFFQNSFITKEYFRGENKYRCESCFGYTEAIRSISYACLPRLLVIHLKRFSGGMEKINSYIPTPFTLHCFCNRCIGLPEGERHHIYKLYSVITHVGATMSVGHYVAYTCSLDILNEAGLCPNQRDKMSVQLGAANGSTNGDKSSSQTTNGNGGGDKNPKSFKRLFFSSRKANSSGDISKHIKANMNGLVNKVVANGIEKLNLNPGNGSVAGTPSLACQGAKCCGIHVKNSKLLSNNSGSGGSNGNSFVSYLNGHLNGGGGGDSVSPPTKSSPSELTVASEVSTNGTVSEEEKVFRINQISQDYWYMCDDDKIKVMSQAQFEEYLSPNRKNMITPYLLFYARFDLNRS